MPRYSRKPSHFKNHSGAQKNASGNKDMKTIDFHPNTRGLKPSLTTTIINGQKVRHDTNDKRPHSIHKVHYTHNGVKKVGFFKRLYKSAHELYQHHLKNKEERAIIHQEEARAALENAEGKKLVAEGHALEIQAQGEAKNKVLLAKAERTRARGEAVREAEIGFGEAAARAQEQRATTRNA